jgi:hypothetical protein
MAKCVYCKVETEMYEGGDVPICVECSDAEEAKYNVRATLTQNLREATARASGASVAFNKIMSEVPSATPTRIPPRAFRTFPIHLPSPVRK